MTDGRKRYKHVGAVCLAKHSLAALEVYGVTEHEDTDEGIRVKVPARSSCIRPMSGEHDQSYQFGSS